ncbi:MAG TPA: zf-TFIIB domain-containing protein [Gemmatimonadales bacterium]|nr:zf-TFIIB domain-containing protein [Gemmatimonadales bacterium]
MNCPACGTAMTEVAAGDLKVQACQGGCGGLWFDEWQLRKVDQPDQSAGEALLHIAQNPAVKVDPNQRRHCPRDLDIVMMRHFWSVKRDVVVNECPKCEGMFLDPGELAQIRAEYASDAERHKAADAYYREMFDTQLAGMLRQDKAKQESARKVAQIFKFICPSYYLPGKQPWGAF